MAVMMHHPMVMTRRGPMAARVARDQKYIGDWFSDAVSNVVQAVTHPADTAGAAWTIATHPADDVSAIVNYGPQDFVDLVRNAANTAADVAKFAANGLSDFAKSKLGQSVLSIATSALYMTLAPVIGPLALLTFAFPGLMAGQDFGPAWLQGFVGQTQRALKAVSGDAINIDILPDEVQQQVYALSDQIHAQVGDAAQYLQQLSPVDLSNITYDQLAQKLGIRVDAAAAALVALRQNPAELAQYPGLQFNPATGALIIKNAQGISVAGGSLFQQADHGAAILAAIPKVVNAGNVSGTWSVLNSVPHTAAILAGYPASQVAKPAALTAPATPGPVAPVKTDLIKAVAAPTSNTGLYIAVGGAAVVVGAAAFLLLRKKRRR